MRRAAYAPRAAKIWRLLAIVPNLATMLNYRLTWAVGGGHEARFPHRRPDAQCVGRKAKPMTSRLTKAKQREVAYVTKRWLAVLVSNIGIAMEPGELDALSKQPEYHALAMKWDPNNATLIAKLTRVWKAASK